MKRLSAATASVVCAVLIGACLSGCGGQLNLPTTNDRLDGTEKQSSYRTQSMKEASPETAYENGWLTQTDLAYAMYYARGKVYTCSKSDWKKTGGEKKEELDWAPAEALPALDGQVESDIIRHYYEKVSLAETISFEEFAENVSFRFVGSYNGTFVVTDVVSRYWEYPTDVPPPEYIAGFVWSGSYAKDLFAFRYDDSAN